jgi:hypothetical protein
MKIPKVVNSSLRSPDSQVTELPGQIHFSVSGLQKIHGRGGERREQHGAFPPHTECL